MNRTMKRWIAVGAAAVAVVLAIVFLVLPKSKNNKKNETGEDVFLYDSVMSSYNYSERAILYLDNDGILHMIDTASGKNVIYCNRPNCTHVGYSHKNPNPSCPAAFSSFGLSGVVLHNKHLYFIGNMTDEDVFRTQYLYETDANGENRRQVATLNNVQNVPCVLYRDKYAIGVYNNNCEINEDGMIVSDNKYESGIFVINLENYKVQMSERLTGLQVYVSDIFYEDGEVYFVSTHFDDSLTEPEVLEGMEKNESFVYANLKWDIYRYDIAGGKTELIKTIDNISFFEMVEGDAYYVAGEEYFVFDSKSRETEKLPIDTSAIALHKDKGLLYFCLTDGDETVFCRLNNGATEELMRTPKSRSVSIANMCGDSVYVMYFETGEGYSLGVLSLDDFTHGRFNVRKLDNGAREESPVTVEEEPEPNAKIITYAIPSICYVDEKNVRKLNAALREDGYDYRLKIQQLSTLDYLKNLQGQLKNGTVDVAFGWMSSFTDGNDVAKFLASGAVLNLDPILAEGKGKVLYDTFPKNLWEASKFDGKNFVIPRATSVSEGVFAVFNRDYIPDEEIEQWDGSIEGIYEILKKTEWDDSKGYRFLNLLREDGFGDMIGGDLEYGLFFDYDSRTIENPLESEKVVGYQKVLEQMRNDGYIADANGYLASENPNSVALYEKVILKNEESGNYLVALESGEIGKRFQKANLVVKQVKTYIRPRIGACTVISNNTKDLDAVLDFLNLLYGEGKYGNILLHGEEGVDYKVVDGVAVNMDGSELEEDFFTKACLNLFINVYLTGADKITDDHKKALFDFYNSTSLSPFLSFQPDTAEIGGVGTDVMEFFRKAASIDEKVPLEELVSSAKEKLKEDGIDAYLESVRSQWEEYCR